MSSFLISSAEFLLSAPDFKTLPVSTASELAFIGRSNVGKSSLINALCERKKLARVSKTPGRTQTFNLYQIAISQQLSKQKALQESGKSRPEKRECMFVDLPGYGYAEVSKVLKQRWQGMISKYLYERSNLAQVFLLIDCRREPGEEERWIAELGREGGLTVVLTKCDKLNRSERKQVGQKMARLLKVPAENIVAVSALSSKDQGLEQLRERVWDLLQLDRAEEI